jgi:hypothetical protein
MTVQNLYTQYLDGKITKQKFLYEVRRDQNLDMISSSNSFDDVVKILKNKSIISEKAHKEAKLATGKQEVDIIAKTIDMVNPYEYSRGMDYELDIVDVPATSGDLDEGNVLRAQKKVLANLTKNPSYYTEKMYGQVKFDGDETIEINKKSIDAIGKGKPKTIREGLEEVADTEADKDMVRKLMAMYKSEPDKFEKLHKQAQTQASTTKDIKFKHMLSLLDRAKAGGKEMDEAARPGYHEDGTPKSNDEMSDDEREAFYNDSNFLDEHGQYADRVADVNADSSPLKERQKAIYEKYAEKTGIPMENLMSMVREAKAKIKEDTFLGKDAIDDLKKHPKYGTLSSDGKKNAEDDLKKGGSVTIG